MSILPSLWRLLDRRQRRQLLALQLLSVLMAATTVGGLAALIPFFTAVADPTAIDRYPILASTLRPLHLHGQQLVLALGIGFASIVVLANAVNLTGFLLINRFSYRVGDALCVRLFDELLRRDYAFHVRHHSSALAGKVIRETERVTSGILQQGLVFVTNFVTVVCIVASVVWVDPAVGAGAVGALGASYAVIYMSTRARLLRNGRAESQHFADRTRTVSESFGAIREIIVQRAREFFVRRLASQSVSLSRARSSTLAIAQSPRHLLECLTVVCLVAVAFYSRSRTHEVAAWFAQLSFIGFAAYRLLPALQQAFAALVRLRTDRTAFEDIVADLKVRVSADVRPRETTPGAWLGAPRHEIRFCDVSYRYAADRVPAVAGVSLSIRRGSFVGIVGANGSGKTTLVDLLSGLLFPCSGHIEIDATRLDRANCAAWQAQLGYVAQQAFLLDATLAENIALGESLAHIDRERLEHVIRLARLTECVASLPRGYEERLGERACRLSGGQRQRVALARALYRHASVLILDEATGALDEVAEREIVDALQSLRPERTIVLVSHRFESLRYCDVLYELDVGRILRSGAFEQLQTPVKPRSAALR